ncbi:NAD-dependent succinate-semialdehyde dehydrogenase [Hydrogenophaga sp. NFH-34]|uniref:NAD-dependent succinate-semialdehyde dehydrogenase n=1 Tax=Hydrogenophaga sp. NFH-34 TaxID=2744446 RepID=UPI001F432754|nr:NAD-dependent succinate-semialdehyde dehydrogenase [Hydrogenophaga sp. NFH-34]
MDYVPLKLLIDGQWLDGGGRQTMDVINPATEAVLGTLPVATQADVQAAAAAAHRSFPAWRDTSAYERAKILWRAGDILRGRVEHIARLMTLEQGKPLDQARQEVTHLPDMLVWHAEEARRIYGRTIPARDLAHRQISAREPIGPVAAFTTWNYPAMIPMKKICAILASGCTCVAKPAEETPASTMEIIRAFVDAGLPPGVLNMVLGAPAQTSSLLVSLPEIRGISFTGSTVIGRQLAELAGRHLKRTVMELGGHAPVIVMDDIQDVQALARTAVLRKFRNAAQGCVNPSRFFVHEKIYDQFLDAFVAATRAIVVDDGFAPGAGMGPLAHARRLPAMQHCVQDALDRGATLVCGGARIDRPGYFWAPTVLTDVPTSALVMNEEPFGPVVPINRFSDVEEAIAEANRLPVGLAAYAFTNSTAWAHRFGRRLEAGMVAINSFAFGAANAASTPEVPFGGIKDSGFGSECGSEGIEAYLNVKFISEYEQV